MEIKLEHFLHDLVWLIKEDYNESLDRAGSTQNDAEKAFADGESLAYFHVLETISNQLAVFGADDNTVKGIAPEPGQKAILKRANF